MSMNRESLRKHCEKMCKMYESVPSSNAYMEHKLVLDLLDQTEWIPVTERLPEEDGKYLLFGKIMTDEDENYIFIGEYDACMKKFGIWKELFDIVALGCLDSDFYEYESVIAWMPLPISCQCK